MAFIPYPSAIDKSKFELPESQLEAKYGLPNEVKFCKVCVISNQRPNSAIEFKHTKESKKQTIAFDEDGVCDACKLAASKKKTINWDEREKELLELCNRYRKNDGSYDCLVPGSGGKDSFYAAHLLKYKYGMNPLTCTWAPHIYTDWGWKNHQAWIHAGFDNILVTPNGMFHRLITRLAVERLYHPFQAFILGQKNLAPKLAAKFDIPLVFYGENEAEYGNPVQDTTKAERDYKYFTSANKGDIYLGGTSVQELKEDFDVTETDLEMYYPVAPEVAQKKQIVVHYLGYYIKWHPQAAYYYSVEHGGFQASPERTPGTYSKYNSIDDKIDDLHYFTTMIKFGIGRATYDAAQEVRSGDITRDEAVALVRRFDGEYPARFEKELLEYLSIPEAKFGKKIASNFENPVMDKKHFLDLGDTFRSPHLWKLENGQWKLRHTVWEQAEKTDNQFRELYAPGSHHRAT